MRAAETTPLYRLENPNIDNPYDEVVWFEALRGQWFTSDITDLSGYIRQVVFDRTTLPYTKVSGSQLAIAEVAKEDLDGYHASRHPIASTAIMERDCFYIIPRDGSVPVKEFGLDKIVSDLQSYPSGRDINKIQKRLTILARLALLPERPSALKLRYHGIFSHVYLEDKLA